VGVTFGGCPNLRHAGERIGQPEQLRIEGAVAALQLSQLLEQPDGLLASEGELAGGHGRHRMGEEMTSCRRSTSHIEHQFAHAAQVGPVPLHEGHSPG
jgi:hypothetical protein